VANSFTQIDREFITRGVRRCSTTQFVLWLMPWIALLCFGAYSAGLCLVKGLNQTNMDNRYAFGLWIFVDLTIIALGAGAFFTGFLLYILKFKELKAVINSAVVIGVVCYSGAMCALMVDVGQPLRAWFTFWYPNVHSMLTEVTFCISCYLTVLAIEYVPILLKNRKLREVPGFDSKLTGVAFGVFVPFFFVVSGMQLDVAALFSTFGAVAKMFLFFGLFLVVRGTPAMLLYRDILNRRERVSLALFTSTQLPLVLAITTLARERGDMRPSTAASLVCAAVLSTLVFPMLGLKLRGSGPVAGASEPLAVPA